MATTPAALWSLETERLRLRRMSLDDADFILELVNDPDWLRHIGDRKVHTLDDARRYIASGPLAMVAKHGFGLDVVQRREDGVALGICGLIRRAGLADVDIGFAFLARHRGRGYALEAARASLAHGRGPLGLARIVAIVSPANVRSIRLLERLGLRGEGSIRLPGDDEDLLLLATAPAQPELPMTRPLRTYKGSCHCGAVRFEIETGFPELTTCDCSLCKRRNALMVKVHESRFRLLQGGSVLREYQFHTHTAKHYFCGICGIYPFHRKRVTPDFYGINVNCLEDFDPAGIPVRATAGAAMT